MIAIGACAMLAAAGWTAEPPAANPLPDVVRTKLRVFSIPFKLPQAQTPDAAPQRVVLSVSKDLGVTWTQAGEAAPNAGAFTYHADADGEYWFQLRSIDAKGRSRGGVGPDIRVLVDAAGPKIAARVWRGGDGEILCRYAAIDDSLRLESLTVEYRSKGEEGWKKLGAEAVLSRESPAHLVGEEIWWAGERVESLMVRISISDGSGNTTVRQFTLEPNDPQVDQAALARELGAPPLPSGIPTPLESSPERTAESRVAAMPTADRPLPTAQVVSTNGAWPGETTTPWKPDTPAGTSARHVNAGAVNLSLTRPEAEGSPTDLSAAGRSPTEYRGRPLRLVRSRRLAWDYEYKPEQGDAGPMRVELWSTRDGGVTWQRTAIDDDATSPIDISLPTSGLYGFRLDIVPDGGDVGGGPQPGESPDCWLGVDDEPPTVELIEVSRAKAGEPKGMVIRYAAHDQMLVPDSVRIAYSAHADGPWTTIAEGLATQGEHPWSPSRSGPAKVHIRVEAIDAAGNVGVVTSPGAVLVSAPRAVGKLGNVTPLPAGTQH